MHSRRPDHARIILMPRSAGGAPDDLRGEYRAKFQQPDTTAVQGTCGSGLRDRSACRGDVRLPARRADRPAGSDRASPPWRLSRSVIDSVGPASAEFAPCRPCLNVWVGHRAGQLEQNNHSGPKPPQLRRLQRTYRDGSTSHGRDQSPDESPGLCEVVVRDDLVEEVGRDLAAGERDGDRSPCRDPRPARE